MREICTALRIALTGKEIGLPIGHLCELLGKQECLNRIEWFLEKHVSLKTQKADNLA